MSRQQSGWQVLRREVLAPDAEWQRFVGIEVWTVEHRSGGGPLTVPVLVDADFVQVIGIAPDNGDLILVLEDKIAEGHSLEACTGGIKAGETPEQAAFREFDEETEWQPGRVIPIGVSVALSDRIVSRTPGNDGAKRAYMFFAIDCIPSPPQREPTEKIESVRVPWRLAFESILLNVPVPGVGYQILSTGTQRMILTLPHHPALSEVVGTRQDATP